MKRHRHISTRMRQSFFALGGDKSGLSDLSDGLGKTQGLSGSHVALPEGRPSKMLRFAYFGTGGNKPSKGVSCVYSQVWPGCVTKKNPQCVGAFWPMRWAWARRFRFLGDCCRANCSSIVFGRLNLCRSHCAKRAHCL